MPKESPCAARLSGDDLGGSVVPVVEQFVCGVHDRKKGVLTSSSLLI